MREKERVIYVYNLRVLHDSTFGEWRSQAFVMFFCLPLPRENRPELVDNLTLWSHMRVYDPFGIVRMTGEGVKPLVFVFFINSFSIVCGDWRPLTPAPGSSPGQALSLKGRGGRGQGAPASPSLSPSDLCSGARTNASTSPSPL